MKEINLDDINWDKLPPGEEKRTSECCNDCRFKECNWNSEPCIKCSEVNNYGYFTPQ